MEDKNKDKNKKNKTEKNFELMRVITLFNQVSITLITTMGLSLFLGYNIDRWLNTTPIFIMVFMIIGVIAAIRNMYVMLTKGMKPKSKEEWLEIYEKEKSELSQSDDDDEEDEE